MRGRQTCYPLTPYVKKQSIVLRILPSTKPPGVRFAVWQLFTAAGNTSQVCSRTGNFKKHQEHIQRTERYKPYAEELRAKIVRDREKNRARLATASPPAPAETRAAQYLESGYAAEQLGNFSSARAFYRLAVTASKSSVEAQIARIGLKRIDSKL